MARHGLTIVGDKNSIPLGGEREDVGVGNSLQLCFVSGEKVHCWLVTPTTFDDRVVEVGVRQEANHPSALPRRHLPAHALEFSHTMRSIGTRLPTI